MNVVKTRARNRRLISWPKAHILAIVVSFSCFGLLFLVTISKSTSFSSLRSFEMREFLLKDDNIKFDYPETWVAQLTPQGSHGDKEVIAFISVPAKFFLNILIARREFTNGDTTVVADWGTLRAQSRFVRYRLINVNDYTSENLTGIMHEYIANSGSPLETQDIHCRDLYFVSGQNGYSFSFCSVESDWAEASLIFDEIMASIRMIR